MCGIFGYVTNKEENLGPILIEAAQRLTYRGYDSVGAATLNNGTTSPFYMGPPLPRFPPPVDPNGAQIDLTVRYILIRR